MDLDATHRRLSAATSAAELAAPSRDWGRFVGQIPCVEEVPGSPPIAPELKGVSS